MVDMGSIESCAFYESALMFLSNSFNTAAYCFDTAKRQKGVGGGRATSARLRLSQGEEMPGVVRYVSGAGSRPV